jgi:hypothetical protein
MGGDKSAYATSQILVQDLEAIWHGITTTNKA